VWKVGDDQELLTIQGHAGPVVNVSFSPDGRRLLSSSLDRTVKLWDTETGREVLTLRAHAAPLAVVTFSSDGSRAASVDHYGIVRVWDGRPLRNDSVGH
jgi:WD40 repeat protein